MFIIAYYIIFIVFLYIFMSFSIYFHEFWSILVTPIFYIKIFAHISVIYPYQSTGISMIFDIFIYIYI